MIYTDRENAEWWKRLSLMDRRELLYEIHERASSEWLKDMVECVQDFDADQVPPAVALRNFRKWAKP